MGNLTTTVNKAANDDTCSFSPAGPFQLDDNAILTVYVGSNFPSGTAITVVTFYAKKDGAKDTSQILGTWNLPEDSPTSPVVVVSNAVTVEALASGGGVKITDIWTSTEDQDDIYFGLTLAAGDETWNPDPELILKKNTSGDLAAEA